MKIILNNDELQQILSEYFSKQGYEVSSLTGVFNEYTTYEYFGFGIHEERKPVTKQRFDGVQIEVNTSV